MTLRRFELRLDHVTDMFELLTVMENQRVIAPDNVNLLFHVLPYKRQKRKVLEYLGKCNVPLDRFYPCKRNLPCQCNIMRAICDAHIFCFEQLLKNSKWL